MGFFERLFGKPQVVESGPTLDLPSLMKSAATDPGARAAALVFLSRKAEWYMCSEQGRGDVPMAMAAPDGALEVLAFSTPQAALVQAQTMSMGEAGTRPVIAAAPKDAFTTFTRMGATQIRFDIYQHDLVVTLSEIRRHIPGLAP